MNHEEDRLQADCAQWIWNTYPETRGTFFHVPNETNEGGRIGAIRKAKGVLAGVPDNVWLWKGKVYLIELKTPTGSYTPSQKLVFPILEKHGFPVITVRSLEDFQHVIKQIVG